MTEGSRPGKALQNVEDVFETPVEAGTVDTVEIDYDAEIRKIQEKLAILDVKKLTLRASLEKETVPLPEESEEELLSEIRDLTIANTIDKRAFDICIRSEAISKFFNDEKEREELMVLLDEHKVLNSTLMALYKRKDILSFDKIVQQNLYQVALNEHYKFLELKRNEQQEAVTRSNPEIVSLQQKIERLIKNLNILNVLIEHFIIADAKNLEEHAFYQELLEIHTKPVTYDNVDELAEKYSE